MPEPRSPGKTARDKLSGKHARHLRNQEARREWNRKNAAAGKTGDRREIPYPRMGR